MEAGRTPRRCEVKALVVYDSQYGNTEQVARAIAEALGGSAVRAGQASAGNVKEHELLVVGSPTQGGQPTAAVRAFLKAIPARGLEGVGVAAFDTRIAAQDSGLFLKLLMGVIGYAAGKIEKSLVTKGGRRVAVAEGFIVTGKEGPLGQGELERAAAWVRTLAGAGTATER
jgi:flavodoxin